MNLTTIASNSFQKNYLLSSVDLSANKLDHIPNNLFQFNSLLAFLDLSQNQLSNLSPEVFLPCPKLTQMILRDNELSQEIFHQFDNHIFSQLKCSSEVNRVTE